MGGLKQVKWN